MASASRNLVTICSAVCLVRFIFESLLDPTGVHRNSHSAWIRIWGAGHSCQYHPIVLERNDHLVRDLEANLLDRYHLRFALFRRGQQTAVSHVLKILGNLLREYETGSMDTDWKTRQTLSKVTVEAAEHAIRWILDRCTEGTHRPGVDWKRKDDEAVHLLSWAVQYSRLYVDHTAWSRGMMVPLVDADAKIVEFQPLSGGLRVLLGQLESEQLRVEDFHESMPPGIDEDLLGPWVRGFTKHDFFNLPTLPLKEESAAYQKTRSWATATILPEINANRDLGGFSLAEFRQFYVRLWLYCQCIARLEDRFDQTLGPV